MVGFYHFTTSFHRHGTKSSLSNVFSFYLSFTLMCDKTRHFGVRTQILGFNTIWTSSLIYPEKCKTRCQILVISKYRQCENNGQIPHYKETYIPLFLQFACLIESRELVKKSRFTATYSFPKHIPCAYKILVLVRKRENKPVNNGISEKKKMHLCTSMLYEYRESYFKYLEKV